MAPMIDCLALELTGSSPCLERNLFLSVVLFLVCVCVFLVREAIPLLMATIV